MRDRRKPSPGEEEVNPKDKVEMKGVRSGKPKAAVRVRVEQRDSAGQRGWQVFGPHADRL